MIKVRCGVFETNSSSVHSMIMCSGDEYEKLENGELLISRWSDKLMTLEEAKEEYKRKAFRYSNLHYENIDDVSDDEVLALLSEHDVAATLDEWSDQEYMESFADSYTTPSGEVVCAFGYYGHD